MQSLADSLADYCRVQTLSVLFPLKKTKRTFFRLLSIRIYDLPSSRKEYFLDFHPVSHWIKVGSQSHSKFWMRALDVREKVFGFSRSHTCIRIILERTEMLLAKLKTKVSKWYFGCLSRLLGIFVKRIKILFGEYSIHSMKD